MYIYTYLYMWERNELEETFGGAPDDPPANWEKPNFKFVYETALKGTKMHAVAWDMSQEATRVPQTKSTLIQI